MLNTKELTQDPVWFLRPDLFNKRKIAVLKIAACVLLAQQVALKLKIRALNAAMSSAQEVTERHAY